MSAMDLFLGLQPTRDYLDDELGYAPVPYVPPQRAPAPRPRVPGIVHGLGLGFARTAPIQTGRGGEDFLSALLSGFGQGYGGGWNRQLGEREMLQEQYNAEAAHRNEQNIRASAALMANRRWEKQRRVEREQARLDREATLTGRAPAGIPGLAAGTPITAGESMRAAELLKPPAPRDEGRLVQVMGPNGVPTWVREAQAVGQPAAQAARAVTGLERQALAYYNRAQDAGITAGALENQVTGAGIVGQAQLQWAPNLLKTPDQRRYRQAQRAFTEARLRKESGAAIPPHEYENDAQTYFAQPGDDQATIAQKRAKREVVLDGLAFSSGRAYEEYFGSPYQRTVAAPPRGTAGGSWFQQNAPRRP